MASEQHSKREDEARPRRRKRWGRWLLVSFVVLSPLLAWRYTRIEPGEPRLNVATNYRAPVYRPNEKHPACPGTVPGKKRVFWGDMHVHTSYSMDAYSIGTRNDPWDAYAFARGKAVTLADGKTKTRIDRPLDFVALTDHAEYFGVNSVCFDPKTRNKWPCLGYRNLSKINRWIRMSVMGLFSRRDLTAVTNPKKPMACLRAGVNCDWGMRNTWKHVQAAAQEAYQRCSFTTFIGYEWTYSPTGRHVHRNVIFGSAQVPEVPYDFLNYNTASALWKALRKGCRKDKGCDVIAIPHNTNWSDGLALKIEGASDEDLNNRAHYERLVEIHQAKGNSECLHPYQDDNATDCRFEISINRMSQALKPGSWLGLRAPKMTRKRWERVASSYVRPALARGLKAYAASGKKRRNPLRLGFVASTDSHNGTPGAVALRNFQGSHGDLDVTVSKRLKSFDALKTNPGGLVGVWAEENTRESIFAALKRRETFGTSGPRIKVKIFHTWAVGDPCKANQSATPTTPMGGSFRAKKGQTKPMFVIHAMQDRVALARLDLIKMTLLRGKVVTQVLRKKAPTNKGAGLLCWAWSDTSFDSKAPALWYARAIEVPTKRWSKKDCELKGTCRTNKLANQMVQQRAWTSPIWHLP